MAEIIHWHKYRAKTKCKKWLWKRFLQENYEDVKNYRYIKLVTAEGKRNSLVSDPNYSTSNFLKRFISKRNEE